MSRLPDFLVVGAMKAGTTALHRHLAAHPAVFMSAMKEPDFFVRSKNWDRGLDWYRSLFDDAPPGTLVGESSTSYSKCTEFPGVPELIASVLPDVRLVYVIREPVERARSMYLHNVLMGRENRPIDRALLDDTMYLDASRYALQLERFVAHFERDQIHVLRSEALRDDPGPALGGLATFLGLAQPFDSEDDAVHYETAQRRVENRLTRTVQQSPLFPRIAGLVPDRVKSLLRRAVTPGTLDESAGDLDPPTRRELTERLLPDLLALRSQLGDDFDAWGLLDG